MKSHKRKVFNLILILKFFLRFVPLPTNRENRVMAPGNEVFEIEVKSVFVARTHFNFPIFVQKSDKA